MIIRFKHEFRLSRAELYSYFQTPADWGRLFPFASGTKELGGGWYAVPLRHFPFPLVARNTRQETDEVVSWVFRGFWRGQGEVRFAETAEGVEIEGYEVIAVRWMFFLSPLIERLFLERRFRAIWKIGWHRLRKQEAKRPSEVS